MKRINVQTDIKPLSEFRANMAELVEEIGKTGQPLVLTQRGKTVAVVMSPQEYETFAYREEFIAAVKEGIAEADAGNLIPHDEVMAYFRAKQAARRKAAVAGGEELTEEAYKDALAQADRKMAENHSRKARKA